MWNWFTHKFCCCRANPSCTHIQVPPCRNCESSHWHACESETLLRLTHSPNHFVFKAPTFLWSWSEWNGGKDPQFHSWTCMWSLSLTYYFPWMHKFWFQPYRCLSVYWSFTSPVDQRWFSVEYPMLLPLVWCVPSPLYISVSWHQRCTERACCWADAHIPCMSMPIGFYAPIISLCASQQCVSSLVLICNLALVYEFRCMAQNEDCRLDFREWNLFYDVLKCFH